MRAITENADQVFWAFAHTVALFVVSGLLALLK